MKGSLTIGKVLGIKVDIHWTFLILLAWVFISGKTVGESWWSLAFVLTVFFCVVLHEFGHAMAAKFYGIKTLDITILPIGGIARIERVPEKPVQELVIALAGPLVNVALALALFIPVKAAMNTNLNEMLIAVNGTNFLVNLFIVNGTLAAFNLLPAFPLDGGRVVRALLSFNLSRLQATRVAAIAGQVLALSIVLLSIVSNQYVQASPSLIFVSLFIFIAAQAELQSVRFSSDLDGHLVEEVLMRDFAQLDANDTISTATDKLLSSANHEFVVFADGKVSGTLSRNEIIKALKDRGPGSKVGDVMNLNVEVTSPKQSLQKAYEQMSRGKDRLLLVMEDQKLKGIVDAENILEFILTRRALAAL